MCGSDLHIYHGRVVIEPGFTLGHEFVGTVVAAGDGVTEVSEGDRVLGCYCSACGNCFFCRRGDFHKCDEGRVFGHGKTLGSLQGAQAEQVLVPHANLTLRRVPEGMSDDAALFAGDVMGTGWHAVDQAGIRPGRLRGGARARPGRAVRGPGGARGGRREGDRDRHGRGAARDRARLRRRAGAPHRGRPARRRQGGHRTGAAWTRRSTPSATPTRSSWPRGSTRKAGTVVGHRRVRRAHPGPHGHRLDQGADAEDRARERDRPRRPGAGDDGRRSARPLRRS